MEEDDIVHEAIIIDPAYMTQEDWAEIKDLAILLKERGEKSWFKAIVVGYIEWAGLDTIKTRKH